MSKNGEITRAAKMDVAHHIAKQLHDKFKIFIGELAADGSIGKLADEVGAFCQQIEDCSEKYRRCLSGTGQAAFDHAGLSR